MFRPAALVLAAALVLTACGGHDKAGGKRSGDAVTIEIAIRDGSTRLLTAYAAAVAHDAAAPTQVTGHTRWRVQLPDAEAQTIADVRSGRVAFAAVPARVLDTLGVDVFDPLLAPLAIDSLEAEQRVLASDIPGRALPALRRLGVVGVAVLPGDLRHPLGIERPLVRPGDYAGAIIGIHESTLQSRAFQRLGADAGRVTGNDYLGFDGIESDLPAIESDRADVGAASLAADLALWPRILVVVANRAAWQRLGPDRQRALRAGARHSLEPAMAQLRARDADAYAVLCRRGEVPFVQSSPAAMRRALAPLTRNLDPATAGEIARMRGGGTTHPPCRPTARARQAGATPVDGVWTFEIDAADLRRAHTPRDDVIPENWGRHVVVLSRGRLAITQEDAQACTWAYGSYAVRGKRLTMDVSDGGGSGPNNAVNRPGEHFEFGWSRFKDMLRLSLVPRAPSPNTFVAAPWRRIGDDPGSAPLSRRCPPPPKALQF
jgi:TRAP-type C4-dicarboxylate transport system substrate-binding protein